MAHSLPGEYRVSEKELQMEMLDIHGLEELARDYTETCRRIIFVLGALDEVAMQVFLDMQTHAPVTIEPGPVPGGSVAYRRSICVSTPAQMIPENLRALVGANVGVYQIIAV
jgi:hypothetical protein